MRIKLVPWIALLVASNAFGVAAVKRADRDVPIRVVVRGSRGGPPIPNAYVGLVPPDRPWSRPLAEGIATDGSWILAAAPGKYRFVVGVAGRGGAVTEAIEIFADRTNDVPIQLPAMKVLSGFVRDEQGRSLTHALVADVNGIIEPPLGRLTELAMSQFGTSWRTSAGEQGVWSLSLPVEAVNPLVAELPGYAIGWHPYDPNRAGPVQFVLKRGGMLGVAVDRLDPAFILTLAARDRASAVPASWQAQVWARKVDQARLEWTSLAPGEYDVYAQQPDRRTFSKAVKVGTVSVKIGETSELRVALPATEPVAPNVSTLFVDGNTRKALQPLEAFGRASSGLPIRLPHSLEASTGGTLLYVRASKAESPLFATTSETFIVAAAEPDSTKAVATAVYELGHAGLHLRSGDLALTLPHAGTATFHCPNDSTVDIPVEVRKDGTSLFPAPAGCSSVVLQFEPFGPVTLARPIASVQSTWLGDYTLYAAGEAGLHVVNDDNAAPAEAAVTIYSSTENNATLIPVAAGTSQPDGWVYFDHLPAGRQLVAIARNGEGDQSLPRAFSVQPRMRTTVDRVAITRAATLLLEPRLDPAFLQQFPTAHIQAVVIEPDQGFGVQKVTRDVEESRAEFRRLTPGRWRMTALISTGATAQPIRGEDVTLSGGETRHLSPTFKPLVFSGRLSAGGKGFEAMVDIRGRDRTDVVPAVHTSAEGRFQVLLPRRDVYEVDVRTNEPIHLVRVGEVTFADPEVPVAIEMPAAQLLVSVRRGGDPLPAISVSARGDRDVSGGIQNLRALAITDAGGEARLEGLLPGNWTVEARDDAGRYARKSLTISSDDPPASAELVLEKEPAINGVVRASMGAPIGGATVECVLSVEGGPAQLVSATTADDGTFSIERKAEPGAVPCSVSSFLGVQGYRFVPGETKDLVLPQRPAELRILSLPPVDRLSMLWLVSDDGRLVNVSRYLRPGADSYALTIPALAPGDWTLVRVSSINSWTSLTRGEVSALPAIAAVSLRPGQAKSIDLRDSAPGMRSE
jgi:hypothetical protein